MKLLLCVALPDATKCIKNPPIWGVRILGITIWMMRRNDACGVNQGKPEVFALIHTHGVAMYPVLPDLPWSAHITPPMPSEAPPHPPPEMPPPDEPAHDPVHDPEPQTPPIELPPGEVPPEIPPQH
ncbi:hypothetical protein ACS7SF_17505 [Ralstonia sp. 25C]|uniref:hypothetical protein n=1 Tax=Ralstonia sp. 25C TaxID=3447363 RepID=UPI003F75436C